MNKDFIPTTTLSVETLIQELNKLPGIGTKTAQRLAYHMIRVPIEEALALANSIIDAKQNTRLCSQCQNLTDSDRCGICTNPTRDQTKICVVEEPLDVTIIERTRCYGGLYHVIHGVISPMNGIGPDNLKLKDLFSRLSTETIEELIIATNPTLEGEATAMYIRRQIAGSTIKVTHLARGLPIGGDLEYADDITLSKAFEGRGEI